MLERVIQDYERETMDEKLFNSVFQVLEHEYLELNKVKLMNSSLGAFIEWA